MSLTDYQNAFLKEKKWLNRLDLIINKNMGNLHLNNEMLANQLEISERQLFRKIKTLTNLTPQKYVLQYRLKKSMRSLEAGRFRTVKEAAFAMGYTKAAIFSNHFKKEFGKSPLMVLKENGWR